MSGLFRGRSLNTYFILPPNPIAFTILNIVLTDIIKVVANHLKSERLPIFVQQYFVFVYFPDDTVNIESKYVKG